MSKIQILHNTSLLLTLWTRKRFARLYFSCHTKEVQLPACNLASFCVVGESLHIVNFVQRSARQTKKCLLTTLGHGIHNST